MPTQRATLAAANCDGAVYAIGGRSGSNKSTSLKPVEKFDSTANKWKYVCDINSKHSHVASVLRRRIYVLGGLDADGIALKEINAMTHFVILGALRQIHHRNCGITLW